MVVKRTARTRIAVERNIMGRIAWICVNIEKEHQRFFVLRWVPPPCLCTKYWLGITFALEILRHCDSHGLGNHHVGTECLQWISLEHLESLIGLYWPKTSSSTRCFVSHCPESKSLRLAKTSHTIQAVSPMLQG